VTSRSSLEDPYRLEVVILSSLASRQSKFGYLKNISPWAFLTSLGARMGGKLRVDEN
jgi:hypothetical protein